jgi:hypothetical protein
MKQRVTDNEKVERVPFEFKLPDDLKEIPQWTVPLPRGFTAEIYAIADIGERYNTQSGHVPVPGYRLVIRNKNGVVAVRNRDVCADQTYHSKLSLALALESAAEVLGRTKTTKTTEIEVGDDE